MNAPDVATLVKQAVDIVEVIGQVVPLRRSGTRHMGRCPFHQEKTPSFQVDSENQLYYCFGCGTGGDVLSFVMKYQNLPFGDAIRYLADRYHIALPEREVRDGASANLAEEARKEREQLYRVLDLAGDIFYQQLHQGEEGSVARDYLLKRSLPPQVVETERLGYALPIWDGLARRLNRSGVDPELAIKAGLIARSSKDNERLYDRFRNRLIFPIRDDRGRIVAFGGRILAKDSPDEPKYLNSPETPVYHKGRMLYQMARAREACRQVRQVVLVEGYMDLLAFHAQGFYRVAATLGTALTAVQVRLLSRFADEVVLAYDADEAGEKAMLRALPLFLQEELPVSRLRFPDGMDPDDFLKAEGIAGFESLVRERKDLGAAAVRKALESWDGSGAGKTLVFKELQPLFDAVRQPVLWSEYARMVADRLSLSEEVVLRQLRYGQREARPVAVPRQAVFVKPAQTQSLEENIVRLLVHHPELVGEVEASGALNHFEEPVFKTIAEGLIRTLDFTGGDSLRSAVYDSLPDEASRELYARLLLDPCDIEDAKTQILDWLQALPRREAKQKTRDLNEALRRAVEEGDSGRVNAILAQIQAHSSAMKRKDSADHV